MARSHVFFDLDGTLTDPEPGIVASFQHAMKALGHQPWAPARLRALIGPPLHEGMTRIFSGDDELVEPAMRHYREHFAVQGMFENRVYPGILQALATLRERDLELRVATSKPQFFADRIIDHFELREFFPRVYGGALGKERSDKSELLAQALTSEGISGEACGRTVMVGDRHHDIEGARAHGMLATGVLWGYGTLPELGGARPDRLVIDVDDLAQVLIELLAERGA